jgi:hypothetical protein
VSHVGRNVPIKTDTPSSGALRMARHRNRRRKGLRCITMEIRETELDTLIRRGWLEHHRRADSLAVRNALYRFFEFYL